MVNPPPSPENRRGPLLAGCLIALAALAVYANCFSVPFLFDDAPSAVDNPTIRHLWTALLPPHNHQGITVEGRPLLNFSLAINYAISGMNVWSYHALNLAIHVLAGLTLFGIMRRTLQNAARGRRSPLGGESGLASASWTGPSPTLFAFAVALLWTVHPLQTESVTYIIQRAESLMGLFYLLTLYCFIRYAEGESAFAEASADKEAGRSGWAVLSFLACFFGMASKEVMASAPLMVFLYDGTFVTGSFGEAWRRRWRFYLGLASTWLVVAALALWTGNRGGTAGFGINIKPWTYALTQFQAIAHYLWLVFWPHPLIFDYGTRWVTHASEWVPYALVIGALVVVTAIGLRRHSPLGFLGVWIFAILAPTSSIIPGNRQTLAEHRMYLPLAAVIAFAVCGGCALLARLRTGRPTAASDRSAVASGRPRIAWLFLLAMAAGSLGALTVRRNEDYRSALVLYRDSVMKRPDNNFAHYNLGKVLDEAGAKLDAIEQYREAIRCDPTRPSSYDNLGKTLSDLGRLPEAAEQYEAALRLNPNDSTAHDNLGKTLLKMGRKAEARDQFYDVSLLRPDDVETRDNLGGVLLELGQIREGIQQLQAALRIDPNLFETHYMLGNAYLLENRTAEAIEQYEQTLRLKPDLADAQANLAAARRQASAH